MKDNDSNENIGAESKISTKATLRTSLASYFGSKKSEDVIIMRQQKQRRAAATTKAHVQTACAPLAVALEAAAAAAEVAMEILPAILERRRKSRAKPTGCHL